ncbi:MAG: hypothetical protein RIC80_20040 [Cyclobacteriaceae bacterium]
MESNFNKESLIDDLVSGRISGGEAEKALQQIQSDPVLSSDFQFQKDLVNQLQAVRKAELKMRLDAVPIEPVLIGGLTATGLLKLGGTAITATLLGVSGYLLLSDQNEDSRQTIDLVPSKVQTIDLGSTSVAQGPKEIQKFELKGIQSLPLTASTETQPLIAEEAAEAELMAPEVVPPNVTELFEEETINSPKLDTNPDILSNPSDEATEIENIKDEKYPFHYKYYSNKLYLYGDFKGIPYDILEVHGKSGRVTYLSYQGKFYQLKNPIKGVKPLIPIGDKDLIKELEILKEEKAF